MSNEGLQKELDFYKAHQKELVEKYEGKFLVIRNQKVEGEYGSEIDAYTEAQKRFELGTFLIQQCLPGENSFTQTFHTRAIFK